MGSSLTISVTSRTACAQGDYAKAQEAYAESLSLTHGWGNRGFNAYAFESIAILAVAQGHPTQALRLLGAAETLREAIGVPIAPVDRAYHQRATACARKQLGAIASAAAWAAGRELTLEQALSEALTYVTLPPAENTPRHPTHVRHMVGTPSHSQPHAMCQPPGGPLTLREREVLRLLAEGLTNKQIAAHFSLSPLTVGKHLVSIYSKLQVSSRTAAVHSARRCGLL